MLQVGQTALGLALDELEFGDEGKKEKVREVVEYLRGGLELLNEVKFQQEHLLPYVCVCVCWLSK